MLSTQPRQLAGGSFGPQGIEVVGVASKWPGSKEIVYWPGSRMS